MYISRHCKHHFWMLLSIQLTLPRQSCLCSIFPEHAWGAATNQHFSIPPPTIPCRKFGTQVEVVCPVCLQVMDSGGHDSSAAGHCPNLLRVGLRISWGGAQVEVSICNVLVLHCYCDGTSGWYSTGSVMGVLDRGWIGKMLY